MTIIRWRNQPGFGRAFIPKFENRTDDRINENCGCLPNTNIIKTDDHYTVVMAVPGLSKESFNIKAEEDVLSVSYNPENSTEEQTDNTVYLRREFQQEAFTRYFTLPETTQSEEIAAQYENGLLKISIHYVNPEKNKFVKAIEVN